MIFSFELFNDTSILVGHFVSTLREREKGREKLADESKVGKEVDGKSK